MAIGPRSGRRSAEVSESQEKAVFDPFRSPHVPPGRYRGSLSGRVSDRRCCPARRTGRGRRAVAALRRRAPARGRRDRQDHRFRDAFGERGAALAGSRTHSTVRLLVRGGALVVSNPSGLNVSRDGRDALRRLRGAGYRGWGHRVKPESRRPDVGEQDHSGVGPWTDVKHLLVRAHNPKVAGSNPAPAIGEGPGNGAFSMRGVADEAITRVPSGYQFLLKAVRPPAAGTAEAEGGRAALVRSDTGRLFVDRAARATPLGIASKRLSSRHARGVPTEVQRLRIILGGSCEAALARGRAPPRRSNGPRRGCARR